MTPSDVLRLDRLILRNYRCFAECMVELHPQLTVLVAENGHGKTAILDAIGIAYGLFVDTLAGTRQLHGFDRTDMRRVHGTQELMSQAQSTELIADGYIDGRPIHWKRALTRYSLRARTTTKEAEELRQVALELRKNVESHVGGKEEDSPTLPLVAFYGTGRLWSEHRLTEGKKPHESVASGRMSGYIDCLSSSSSFKGFVAWYETQMNAARDPRFAALPAIKRPERLLAAVRESTRVVLEPTGWCELDWDFEQKLLVVEHADKTRLPLSALSDGVRNMIALVADVAYRCVSLNPHLNDEAARQTPGLLLIDEVDMHLHPSWQQQVVELLRQAFPTMQMVLSTHSPHVLSTVDMKSIRMIRLRDGEGVLETPRFQTRGVESADVLANIMGVDPVPHVEPAQWLSDYRALIQQHSFDTPSGRAMRARLEAHFGNEHPVMLDCDRMIRLERFRQTLPPMTS